MQAALVKLLVHFFALLPLRLSHAIGTVLGYLGQIIPNSLQQPARTNIDVCLPELTAQQRSQVYRQCFIELGRATTEAGALLLWDRERLLRLVKQVSGKELVDKALAKGKGVILVTPHLGAWEMAGLYASLNYPMTTLYRPLRMTQLNQILKQSRERFGANLVPTDAGGVRALYKALRNNQGVGILPDQNPPKEFGVFAPFFGIDTNTMTLLPKLATKTEATIVYTFAERLPKGRGYHIHFFPASGSLKDLNLVEAAALINKDVETCIRYSPGQYYWPYKRFKIRPEGEASIY